MLWHGSDTQAPITLLKVVTVPSGGTLWCSGHCFGLLIKLLIGLSVELSIRG